MQSHGDLSHLMGMPELDEHIPCQAQQERILSKPDMENVSE